MSKYIDISYVEEYLGEKFTKDTTPSISQVSKYLDLAESNFERIAGDWTLQTGQVDIVDSYFNGEYVYFKTTKFPLSSITSVEVQQGTRFDPSWSTLATDEYVIEDAEQGMVYLSIGIKGTKQYQVTYDSGYLFDDVPYNIKYTVFLMTMREIFSNTMFASNGNLDGSTEIIDVDVYREITKGGNPYNGLQAIDSVIQDSLSLINKKTQIFIF